MYIFSVAVLCIGPLVTTQRKPLSVYTVFSVTEHICVLLQVFLCLI